jgi:hypothetical protein
LKKSVENPIFTLYNCDRLLSCMSIAQTNVGYTSPIADYQKFVDEKVLPWKAANDKVGEIGGWRAYAKEAQFKEAQANALTVPPTVAASAEVLHAEKIAKAPLPVRTAWLHAVLLVMQHLCCCTSGSGYRSYIDLTNG